MNLSVPRYLEQCHANIPHPLTETLGFFAKYCNPAKLTSPQHVSGFPSCTYLQLVSVLDGLFLLILPITIYCSIPCHVHIILLFNSCTISSSSLLLIA